MRPLRGGIDVHLLYVIQEKLILWLLLISNDQDRVADFEIEARSLQQQIACRAVDRLQLCRNGLDGVPASVSHRAGGRLKGLRRLAWPWQALHLRPDIDIG